MRNSRKEIHLIGDLAETILQFRMDANPAHIQHLKSLRKEIKKKIIDGTIQPGIAHLLVKNDFYKIKNRLAKTLKSSNTPDSSAVVCIRIQCIEKANCSIFNEQLWELRMLGKNLERGKSEIKKSNTGITIAELIEFLLTNLFCYSLLPLSRHQRNKYMIDYKILFQEDNKINLSSFDTLKIKEAWGLQEGGNGVSIKIFSN